MTLERARKPRPHSETAYLPMNDYGAGEPQFSLLDVRALARDARNSMACEYPGGWAECKKLGWRIVKVKIEVIR